MEYEAKWTSAMPDGRCQVAVQKVATHLFPDRQLLQGLTLAMLDIN